MFPYRALPHDATPSEAAEISSFNAAQKRACRRVRSTFVDAGQLGERFLPTLQAMLAKMQLPLHAQSRADLFPHGHQALAPSYFALLRHLVSSGRDFAVVFRTFGTDLPEVVMEHNAFCEGRDAMSAGFVFIH